MKLLTNCQASWNKLNLPLTVFVSSFSKKVLYLLSQLSTDYPIIQKKTLHKANKYCQVKFQIGPTLTFIHVLYHYSFNQWWVFPSLLVGPCLCGRGLWRWIVPDWFASMCLGRYRPSGSLVLHRCLMTEGQTTYKTNSILLQIKIVFFS